MNSLSNSEVEKILLYFSAKDKNSGSCSPLTVRTSVQLTPQNSLEKLNYLIFFCFIAHKMLQFFAVTMCG